MRWPWTRKSELEMGVSSDADVSKASKPTRERSADLEAPEGFTRLSLDTFGTLPCYFFRAESLHGTVVVKMMASGEDRREWTLSCEACQTGPITSKYTFCGDEHGRTQAQHLQDDIEAVLATDPLTATLMATALISALSGLVAERRVYLNVGAKHLIASNAALARDASTLSADWYGAWRR